MNPQTTAILYTIDRAYENGTIETLAEAHDALEAYRNYFEDLMENREPRVGAFTPGTDELLDDLEAMLNERVELELDDMLLGEKYATLDELSFEAFDHSLALAREIEGDGDDLFEWMKEFPSFRYDRKWLLSTHGIRLTPNDVRPVLDEVYTLAQEEVATREPEAHSDLLLQIADKYKDDPLLTADLVVTSSEDTLLEKAEKYLRPLTDYPAGALGFYSDEELKFNLLARCRVAFRKGDIEFVYQTTELMLRLGMPREVVEDIGMNLTSYLMLTRLEAGEVSLESLLEGPSPRKEYPLTSQMVSDLYFYIVASSSPSLDVFGPEIILPA